MTKKKQLENFIYGIFVGVVVTLFFVISFNLPPVHIGFYPDEGIMIRNLTIIREDYIIGCASSPDIIRNTSTCISVLKQAGWSDKRIRDKNVYCDYSNATYHEPVCMWDDFDLKAAIKRWDEQPKAYAGGVVLT